ncbi:CubicO group peptidase, beta-lactamase class C family [Formosa sp. Hel1_31_208]|uniref:serine hydrolase n=1 Tax=Formosa sp. Hel1_31_208 TaxID=1798225 RepID=UPI0008793EF9|nr:serine hydrolase [Formosa sp. Hel1_31_208]SDS67637.1 CubicO group peptidase, beta-lactamase class C family [Formosa sp. Hel1_31_208]
MKKSIFLLFILFTSLSLSQSNKRLKGIEKQLNTILDLTKSPGFAVAVVEGDKIVYAKGFGYSDYENKVPVDEHTLFAIGSSTKAFTSGLLGVLRDEEKLSFDDSPLDYIPDFKFYNSDMNNTIIIKDLMRHSTGLPRHDASWYFFPNKDKDSLLMRVKYQEPFTGVRQQWYYNNFMFLAQGVITEKITGKSWEENIETHFFKPLGMTRSKTDIEGMKSSSNAAFGYELKDNTEISKMDYYDISGMAPAGSINSSVNDMSKWITLWLQKGKYQDQQIIPEDYIKEAMSSQMVLASGLPDDKYPDMHFANYGYGWMLGSYKGHYRVEHGGNIDGFSASVAFFPTDNMGIVVLANQNGSAVPSLVRNTIADYMLEVDKTDWIGRFKENLEKSLKAQDEAKDDTEKSNVKNTKPSHIKLDYTGSYHHDGYGKFNVIVENDTLFTELDGDKLYLHHFHYDTFELIDVVKGKVDTSAIGQSLKVTFLTNESGDISDMESTLEPTVDPIVFKRTPSTIDVDKETLETYVGDYNLAGTIIKVYLKDENVLYLFVQGQPEYELLATAKHKFSFKTLEGFKVEFVEDDKGGIIQLKAIQPNGTFVATKNPKE